MFCYLINCLQANIPFPGNISKGIIHSNGRLFSIFLMLLKQYIDQKTVKIKVDSGSAV